MRSLFTVNNKQDSAESELMKKLSCPAAPLDGLHVLDVDARLPLTARRQSSSKALPSSCPYATSKGNIQGLMRTHIPVLYSFRGKIK